MLSLEKLCEEMLVIKGKGGKINLKENNNLLNKLM